MRPRSTNSNRALRCRTSFRKSCARSCECTRTTTFQGAREPELPEHVQGTVFLRPCVKLVVEHRERGCAVDVVDGKELWIFPRRDLGGLFIVEREQPELREHEQ